MNILVYRYGSICEPDIIDTFRNMGFSVDTIDSEIYDKNINQADVIDLMRRHLDKKQYTFVFTINFFPTISALMQIVGIPYLCWIVDSPILELYSNQLSNSCNRIFLFDKALYDEFHPYNPDGVFHLPLATNTKRWAKVIDNASDMQKSKYKCDVSFVGSLYSEKNPYSNMRGGSDYLKGFLSGIMDAQLRIYGGFFLEDVLTDDIVSEFKSHMPSFYTPPEDFRVNDKAFMAQLYLGSNVTCMEREQYFSAIAKRFDFSLYTGSDVSYLPFLKSKGRVKTLTEMPLVFNGSTINLNPTAKSIRSGLPLRIWDILGCRGFIISNYQAEIPEHFVDGEDLAIYDSLDTLLYLIEYYLSHPKRAHECAMSAYEKVCKFHTYEIRLGQMLKLAFDL